MMSGEIREVSFFRLRRLCGFNDESLTNFRFELHALLADQNMADCCIAYSMSTSKMQRLVSNWSSQGYSFRILQSLAGNPAFQRQRSFTVCRKKKAKVLKMELRFMQLTASCNLSANKRLQRSNRFRRGVRLRGDGTGEKKTGNRSFMGCCMVGVSAGCPACGLSVCNVDFLVLPVGR